MLHVAGVLLCVLLLLPALLKAQEAVA